MSLLQVIGICYLIIGIGLLINTKYYRKMLDNFAESKPVMFLSGILSLIAGYFLIRAQNMLIWDWSVIITVIGWIALIKGSAIILMPKVMLKMAHYFTHRKGWMVFEGIVATILGAIITYIAFLA
ncbi:MAG: hypothetical protein V1851_00910 [Patescibacteria group bacterium]